MDSSRGNSILVYLFYNIQKIRENGRRARLRVRQAREDEKSGAYHRARGDTENVQEVQFFFQGWVIHLF